MNNKFYEIPQDWYSELNGTFMNNFNSMPNINMINNNNLADPKVALDRGNLFNNLYDPYKNYQYRPLKPNNKREELLYNILMHNFALVELNLYLDLNERDSNMISLYNKYLENKKRLINEYENNYGPLTCDAINKNPNDWDWNDSPWPWEVTK